MLAIDPLVRSSIASPPYLQRLIAYLPNVGIPLTITFLLLRYTDLRRRAAEARSEELLTNAIPAAIATRLKHGEERIAEAYAETTVLFADIVGFTPWAQRTAPDRVVALLDGLFSRFDELAARHGVERIKTIGDSYVAVVGAPEPRPDHAGAALELARGARQRPNRRRRHRHPPDPVRRMGRHREHCGAHGVVGRARSYPGWRPQRGTCCAIDMPSNVAKWTSKDWDR